MDWIDELAVVMSYNLPKRGIKYKRFLFHGKCVGVSKDYPEVVEVLKED